MSNSEPTTNDATADVDLDDFGLFEPSVQQCPHAYYAKMQQEAPLYEAALPVGAPLQLITRYEDVDRVVRDSKTYSSKFDTSGSSGNNELTTRMAELYEAEGGYDRIGTMLTVDPPDHTRYRRLVSKAFTPKVIADLEPTIRSIAKGLVDDLVEAGRDGAIVDFVQVFGVPLPVTVIAKALNVPDDRLADFKRWSDASIAGIGTNITIDQRIDAEREVIEFQKYFADQIDQRRTAPQDDILTNLLNARVGRDDVGPDGEPLDDEPLVMAEMLSIIQQILVAGNETTTKMLTEMMRLLGENPDDWKALQDDAGLAKPVVEETLRLSTPTQGMFRVVNEDAEIAGGSVVAGDRVVIMFSAANRDPEVFEDPDSFCPARENLSSHLAFGKGIHFCLGAALSRLEGKVAAEELSKRLTSFELADTNDFAYHPSFMLRGLVKLDIKVGDEQ